MEIYLFRNELIKLIMISVYGEEDSIPDQVQKPYFFNELSATSDNFSAIHYKNKTNNVTKIVQIIVTPVQFTVF